MVVILCVSMHVFVTMLAATYLIYMLKAIKVPLGIYGDFKGYVVYIVQNTCLEVVAALILLTTFAFFFTNS